ncbi:unnamed protein product [Lepeophtheirus salmonis]|uniref:(salmon louse) hypothetical protein n=1 Tax=Lepeophtheirus salmonis TaxID=72036 RepID=A0A7R8HB80_LEPSM|nr:unnamed protein product [Lepeophtheirus salmonis]CAF2977325.1 unnamed protein product [Lepeophtheirus salmonis]
MSNVQINPSGRNYYPFYKYFDKLPPKSGIGCRAKYKYCQVEMQGLVARLKFHREKYQQKQQEVGATDEELDDPDNKANELNEEEMNMAIESANEKYQTLVPIIMKFQARSPPFQLFKLAEPVTKQSQLLNGWNLMQIL